MLQMSMSSIVVMTKPVALYIFWTAEIKHQNFSRLQIKFTYKMDFQFTLSNGFSHSRENNIPHILIENGSLVLIYHRFHK